MRNYKISPFWGPEWAPFLCYMTEYRKQYDIEKRIKIFILHMEKLDLEITKLPDNPNLEKLFRHNDVAQEHLKTILYDILKYIECEVQDVRDEFYFLD